MGAVNISTWGLALTLVFILVAGISSIIYKLKLERDLFWGTLRMLAQLAIMGYALKYIFGLGNAAPAVLVLCGMIFFAARIIVKRVNQKDVPFGIPVFLSMLSSYLLVTMLVTGVIIDVKPWWTPRYFIPLGGMIVGNSMNSIAIALERLFSVLKSRRNEVEMLQSLGADYKEATQGMVREAMKAGMIPAINSLMGVGLVFIPGMMTGQILAGSDPLLAIRYQIVVMLMLVGATAMGSLTATLMVRRMCFGPGQRLIFAHDKPL